MDTGGNVVSIGSALTLRATADSDVTLTRVVKTRTKNGLAKFPSIDLTARKSAKAFTLRVDGEQNLLSAQLICRVVLSNAVVGMKHTLSVNQLSVASEGSSAIELLTEDGNKFVPSADSLQCEIKRKHERKARPFSSTK